MKALLLIPVVALASTVFGFGQDWRRNGRSARRPIMQDAVDIAGLGQKTLALRGDRSQNGGRDARKLFLETRKARALVARNVAGV